MTIGKAFLTKTGKLYINDASGYHYMPVLVIIYIIPGDRRLSSHVNIANLYFFNLFEIQVMNSIAALLICPTAL